MLHRDWSLGKERDPPNPNFEPPSNTFVATYEGITAKFIGIDDAEGLWKCGIDDIQQKGEIEVSAEDKYRKPRQSVILEKSYFTIKEPSHKNTTLKAKIHSLKAVEAAVSLINLRHHLLDQRYL